MTEGFSFTDLIGKPEDPPCRIRARFHLLPTEASGRTKPIYFPYRPNHNFGQPNNRTFYIGQIEWPRDEPIFPGDTRDVDITFLGGPSLAELLIIGRQWRIQEGGNLVATAEVLEALDGQ